MEQHREKLDKYLLLVKNIKVLYDEKTRMEYDIVEDAIRRLTVGIPQLKDSKCVEFTRRYCQYISNAEIRLLFKLGTDTYRIDENIKLNNITYDLVIYNKSDIIVSYNKNISYEELIDMIKVFQEDKRKRRKNV